MGDRRAATLDLVTTLEQLSGRLVDEGRIADGLVSIMAAATLATLLRDVDLVVDGAAPSQLWPAWFGPVPERAA